MRELIIALFLLGSFSAMAVEQIQVLGLFSGKAILLVDGQRYTLQEGQSTPEGVKLIAADSDRALLEVDGKQRKLELGSQISSHYPEAEKKVVDLYPDMDGMYRGSAFINGQSVNFLLDTGATSIAMSSVQAGKLAIDYRRVGIPAIAETASGQVKVYLLKLDQIALGTIRVYGVEAMVIEGGQPREVLLGQSFLNQLHMKREGALLRLEQGH